MGGLGTDAGREFGCLSEGCFWGWLPAVSTMLLIQPSAGLTMQNNNRKDFLSLIRHSPRVLVVVRRCSGVASAPFYGSVGYLGWFLPSAAEKEPLHRALRFFHLRGYG